MNRRTLSARVAKLEPQPRTRRRIPHVLFVRGGEAPSEALARLQTEIGAIPRGHRWLAVPPRDQTPADDADFEAAFFAHQTRLVAEARSASARINKGPK